MSVSSAPSDARPDSFASNSQGPGFPRVALYALGGAYFVLGCSSLGAVGMVEQMQLGLGVSAAAVASLVTVFSLVYAVTAPIAQAVAGHLKRRMAIAGGLCAIAGGCVLSALAPSYELLIAARLIMGLGAAMTGPFLTAAAATLVAPQDRARALSTVFAGVTASSVLGVPLASFLAQEMGWRWAWGALGAAALVFACVVWLLLPAGNKGARASLKTLAAVLRNRTLALTIAALGGSIIAQFSTFALIAVWMARAGGVSAEMIPPALFLFGVGGIAGNALAAPATRYLGGRGAAMASMTFCLAAMLALPLAAGSEIAVLAVMTIWSGAGMMVMVPVQSLLVQLDPERASLTLALNSSAVYLGMAVGATVAGASLGLLGAAAMPLVSAGLMVCALGVLAISKPRA